MHLKLGKSFPLLKFKPSITQPLTLPQPTSPELDVGRPFHSFQDLIELDYGIALLINDTKNHIQQYISAITEQKAPLIKQLRVQLQKLLTVLADLLDRLEYENLDRDISEVFRGPDGLYALYQYIWTPNLLHLLCKIKAAYQSKPNKQQDLAILIHAKQAALTCEIIEQVLHRQAKFILKQFASEMYILPEGWGRKLAFASHFDQEVLSAYEKDTYEDRLLALTTALNHKAQKDSRITMKALLFMDIEEQFVGFITLLKAILLNKVSGIFSGDYETWEQIYDVSLKLYCKKEEVRGRNGLQVDQLVQHQIEDSQFTAFLLKSDLATVSLCSMMFYFKNCPLATKDKLRPVIIAKIGTQLKFAELKQFEDILEYLQTEAQPPEKTHLLGLIEQVLHRCLFDTISPNTYHQAQKSISDLLQYLFKHPKYFHQLINPSIFTRILQKLVGPTCEHTHFLYSFLNSFITHAYEQQFDFSTFVAQHPTLPSLFHSLSTTLLHTHGLLLHENVYPICLEWKKIVEEANNADSQTESKEDIQLVTMVEWSEVAANLMLVAGRDCDFKMEAGFRGQDGKEEMASAVMDLFRVLSDAQFGERKEMEKYLEERLSSGQPEGQRARARSYLAMKGFKDRLLHENLMNLAVKLNPSLAFAQVSTFAAQFLSFMTPQMIDQPLPMNSHSQCAQIQPFDVCDMVSGQQPIECMKLIFKKLGDLSPEAIDFSCLDSMPLPLLKLLGEFGSDRTKMAAEIVGSDYGLDIVLLDQMEEVKKFMFYAELMTKVFHKLNQKSQRGIKEIKVIYSAVEKTCMAVWKSIRNRIISSSIMQLCRRTSFSAYQLKQSTPIRIEQLAELHYSQLVKWVKVPFIDNVLSQQNSLTRTCQQFICSICKILHPNLYPSQYNKLFDPLEIITIQAIHESTGECSQQMRQSYEFIGGVVQLLGFIEFTCCNEEEQAGRDKQECRDWSAKWRDTCRGLTEKVLQALINYLPKNKQVETGEGILAKVFTNHLKTEIIKILIPFMIKDTLKNPDDNPKGYQTQLNETFHNFYTLCQIVEKISPGEEQHLMTFLQIFQGFDSGSSKAISTGLKTSEFLYRSIQSLLELVFTGIRVRSYHFYKFIRSYLRLTKEKDNYLFFNSVIAYYIDTMMKSIMGQFVLPASVLHFCDSNMNPNSTKAKPVTKSPSKQPVINEQNLKSSVNRIRFGNFTRFGGKFTIFAEQVCIISMFVNLFCRLNFKSLTEGIEKIWQHPDMHLLYIGYLQHTAKTVAAELAITDQKLLDIINVDCFGNLAIILKGPLHASPKDSSDSRAEQHSRDVIYQLLQLVKIVLSTDLKTSIKNSLQLPVRKLTAQIHSPGTPDATIEFISQSISQLHLSATHESTEILDMILTCYSTKLSRDVTSNVHETNLNYLSYNSEMKQRVWENNAGLLGAGHKGLHAGGRGKTEGRNYDGVEVTLGVTQQAERLIHEVVGNFIQAYTEVFPSTSTVPETPLNTLFAHLKILSVLTLNNPQLLPYLTQYHHLQLSVFDVMLHSASTSLPIFAELYMLFLRTNCGFVELSQGKYMPNSFVIECRVWAMLVEAIEKGMQAGGAIEGVVKALGFVVRVNGGQSRPHMRSYKFGNLANYVYHEVRGQYERRFYERLAHVLKKGIEKMNAEPSLLAEVGCDLLLVLELHQLVVMKVVKQSDLASMKLGLDLRLKESATQHQIPSFKKTKQPPAQPPALHCPNLHPPAITPQSPPSLPSPSHPLHTQLLSQQAYNFVHQLNCHHRPHPTNLQLLQKMMQYSARQSLWQDVQQQQQLMLRYPQSDLRSSYGLTVLGSVGDVSDGVVEDRQFDSIVEDDEPDIAVEDIREIREEQHSEYDGIVEDNFEQDPSSSNILNQSQQFLAGDELQQSMSQTSLQFLSQHSVKLLDDVPQPSGQMDYSKNHLLCLYEQSTVNPEARRQLLTALTHAPACELQKFIANQAVDEEIEMLVVRQLWGRGLVPSATSISKSSRYYGGGVTAGSKCLSLYVNEAILYRKMYEAYQKSGEGDMAELLVPRVGKEFVLCLFGHYFVNGSVERNKRVPLWDLLQILILNAQNCVSIIQVCLLLIGASEAQLLTQLNLSTASTPADKQPKITASQVKLTLINNLLGGCIRDRVGLHVLLTGSWDPQAMKLSTRAKQSCSELSLTQIGVVLPVLEFVLQQSCLLDQVLRNDREGQNGLIYHLWDYFKKCDEFKVKNKAEEKDDSTTYPYYQIQQSIRVSELIIRKIVDRLFAQRQVIGENQGEGRETSLQELFLILIYLDPNCFEHYFRHVVDKVTARLGEIIRKQQKTLSAFKSTWNSSEKDSSMYELQKEEKYWGLRQSKKSMGGFDQDLHYFRSILVDICLNLLPNFRKIRFSYHCGKSYRQWKLEIEILKQKLLSYGSLQGLTKLEEKEKQLEAWRRNQTNTIINHEILPIFEQHSQQFLSLLSEAESFISQFLQTFQIKQRKQKIVIFNSCAKLYEILLAAEILTQEEKLTYHSMSKLKTMQSIESSKNVRGFDKRKSSLNKKGARLSINSCMPKVESLLRKIGSSCTFLYCYLGKQPEIRQLHAKYSDTNKRLKVLWADQQTNYANQDKSQQFKIIECRRTHILQDTLEQIDQDFINLPVKVKFQGQIGVDYGGVTRQWITLFIKQIISPELGLFSLSANKLTFQPNPDSDVVPNHLRYFRKIGILVGKAMKENWLLEVNLTKSFLKHLLGSTLYIEDLEDIDPETAKSLMWILNNNIGYDDELGLTFSYEIDRLGSKKVIELVPGGEIIPVTEENKKKYIKLVANMKMTQSIREQSKAFMSGLESVIPYSTLSLFSYKQISLYLSGMPSIDIQEMQKHARYENFTPESQQILWFWEIMHEWSQEQLANFLFFLTGSYKVPYGGFSKYPIGFNKLIGCTDYLPVAHTCFSVMDISEYSTKLKMQKLLRKSIKEGKGFSVS